MKIFRLFFTILLIAGLTSCGGGGASSTTKESKPQKEPSSSRETTNDLELKQSKVLAIPAYFYNPTLWERLKSIKGEMVVVVNPDNGAGEKSEKHYLEIISSLNSGGKKPIGYISTDYAQRDLEEIKSEIERWLRLYPDIKGFFFDEVSIENFKFYEEIAKFVKSKGSLFIMLNSGTLPPKDYFKIADNIVVYEGSMERFPESREICQEARKSTIIVYGAESKQMRDLLLKKCKFYFVSDVEGGRAYLTLPSYFEDELKELGY